MRIVKLKCMRQINGLHYAPDGRRLLAVGGYEVRSVDEARWVDVGGGMETMRVPLRASCYAVSSDLTRMAVGNSHTTGGHIPIPPVVTFDPTAPTWHENESRWREVLSPLLSDQVFSLSFCPHGVRLAASFRQQIDQLTWCTQFAVFNVDDLDLIEMHDPDAEESESPILAFSPDGSRIANSCGIINSHTAKYVGLFTPPGTRTRQLVYSPDDGNTLAVANAKAVLLLPPDLSAPRLTLIHPKQVNAVAFAPDGRRVLTTCTDKLVRVWDATTGQLVTSYDWNVGVTNAIAVAPDGLTAAVSGQSGRVVLFDLEG